MTYGGLMPYTKQQKRLFHGVAAGSIPPKPGLSRNRARTLAAEADRLPARKAKKKGGR